MHRPEAIANEFLRRRASNRWPQLMYIQKLVYIAHGWNLAINDAPLVNEAPLASDYGPIFRSLWDHVREYWYSGDRCLLKDPLTNREIREQLSPSETEVIDHVWMRYGRYGARELSAMTLESNTPWYTTYMHLGRDAPLSDNEIKDYYLTLAKVARAAA